MLISYTTYHTYAQEINMSQQLTLHVKRLSLEETLDSLKNMTGIPFVYNHNLIKDYSVTKTSFINLPYFRILDNLFSGKDISYKIIANQIILFYEKEKPKVHRFLAKIQDAETFQPVAYAAVGIKNTSIGAISDYKGNVELVLKERFVTDTMYIACMGYETRTFPLKVIRWNDTLVFNLNPKIIEMPEVSVNSSDFEMVEAGNTKLKEKGSLYLDTHGQQVALYIPNETQQNGILRHITYYLSEDGNTDAPFRIRIYTVDTLTGKPGKDLLNRILIAKPEKGAGWYKADVTEFYISIPKHGFFAAMEGIYPNDYEYYTTHGKVVDVKKTSKKEKENPKYNLSYGQRIGYNKKEEEHTWHYSLSHTWFQLSGQTYGIMIGAHLEVRKTEND